jgi:hypothetical protein
MLRRVDREMRAPIGTVGKRLVASHAGAAMRWRIALAWRDDVDRGGCEVAQSFLYKWFGAELGVLS